MAGPNSATGTTTVTGPGGVNTAVVTSGGAAEVSDAVVEAAVGTPSDATWALTGTASIIAAVKAVATQTAGTGAGMNTLNANFSTAVGNQATGTPYNPPTGGTGFFGWISGIWAQLVLLVAGLQTPVSVTTAVTVTASSAYSAGNAVGTLIHLSNFFPTSVGGEIRGIRAIVNGSVSTPSLGVYLFKANPSNSTFTDKAALTINSADWAKIVLGTPSVQDQAGTSGYPTFLNFINSGATNSFPISIAGTDVWFVLYTTGTPTFSTTADVNLIVEGVAY